MGLIPTAKRAFRKALCRALGPFIHGRGTILCQHRILKQEDKSPLPIPRDLELSTNFLSQLLGRLKDQGCEFVSLDELLENLASSRSRRMINITFDDGYRDNLTEALPIFEEFAAPFTVYVTPGLLDGTIDPWWYSLQTLVMQRSEISLPSDRDPKTLNTDSNTGKETAYRALYRLVADAAEHRLAALDEIWSANHLAGPPDNGDLFLTWDELRQLDSSPLVTIGAHTLTHPRLSWLDNESINRELSGSRERLEHELGHPVHHVAYPHGSERDLPLGISDLAEAAGFKTGTTTLPRMART